MSLRYSILRIRYSSSLVSLYNITLASTLVLSITNLIFPSLGLIIVTSSFGVAIIYLWVVKLSKLIDWMLTIASSVIGFPLMRDFNIARVVLVTLNSSQY